MELINLEKTIIHFFDAELPVDEAACHLHLTLIIRSIDP